MYPLDWPVVGVLPFFATRLHALHDQLTVVLAASGLNFKAQGPLASGMRFFLTCDPANVRHIFTSNHANYPKGEELAEIFDIVRGSVMTVDGEAGRQQRALFHSALSNPKVLGFVASCCRDKVVGGLLPFLARMAGTRTPFDMKELATRLVFDLTATLIFGVDPGRLPSELDMPLPSLHVATAMDTVMEVALLRQAMPASIWKLMRQLNVGPERKMAMAHKQLQGFIREMTERRREARCAGDLLHDDVAAMDILSANPVHSGVLDLLRSEILLNFMIAGRDTVGTTLPWVFYSLAKNPRAVSAIRSELAPFAARNKGTSCESVVVFEPEDTRHLVYLQAAIFETLRLYPAGPSERKTALADDVLPSGHRLYSGETIIVSIYAMGRMEALWGSNCHEYRPERWLSDDGAKLRHVPSHKFMAFNSGPRMCLGKDIAIKQMKAIVAAVVWNFDVEVLEGQSIQPKASCILQMKNALMVTVNKADQHTAIWPVES